jgi:DNA mismatch repair protein MutS
VPAKSLDAYIGKLIRAGRKVAICDQVEDAKLAKGKLVKREVTRIVTPGTITEDELLDAKAPNYIAAVWGERGGKAEGFLEEPASASTAAEPSEDAPDDGDAKPARVQKPKEEAWGLAVADLSTGSFAVSEFRGAKARHQLREELSRLQPAELILPEELALSPADILDPDIGATATRLGADDFRHRLAYERLLRQFGAKDLSGFGAEEMKLAQRAGGALVGYLEETQKRSLGQFGEMRVSSAEEAMTLDYTTQRSLELVEPLHHRAGSAGDAASRKATLLGSLDATITGMGGRTLREWLLRPLRDRGKIESRLDAIESLVQDDLARQRAREALNNIRDFERIAARLAARSASPRDLAALRASLAVLPALLASIARPSERSRLLEVLREALEPIPGLHEALEKGLSDSPPNGIKEGGLIKAGYSEKLDEIRNASHDSKEWIAQFRAREAHRSGIPSLKIGFNRVFGYYIEITRTQLRQAPLPENYIRRQTLSNCERFITDELKEKEDIILHAEERANTLEEELFLGLRDLAANHLRDLQRLGKATGSLDALLALAEVAATRGYSRPTINNEGILDIQAGRHPVLEAIQPDPSQAFVPNDASLSRQSRQIALITGPNMAGKSTYIRQVALITLMAHMGSFVPADGASVCLVDRIFTRVGAMDHLAKGQSTFLVEMSETANILNNCSDESLVILDEIGRGTSTYDGLSIAWAVMERLHNTPQRRPISLFATHYHELTSLDEHLPRVFNLNVAVHEEPQRRGIVFLYKIMNGSTDRSYGIHAARLAGMPRDAVRRAEEILVSLEEGRGVEVRSSGPKPAAKAQAPMQLTLFDFAPHPVVDKLRALDVNTLTPLQALQLLERLKKEALK